MNNDTTPLLSPTIQPPHDTIEFKTIKILCYCVILLCSTVGNGLVIHVIKNTEKMRTPSNILVLNLAVCDLVTPLLSIPFDFVLEENHYEWLFGEFMCKTLWPGVTLSTTSSSLTLAAISFDRYRLIMHPFKHKLTMKNVKVIITAIHTCSVFVVTPYIYVLRLHGNECRETWSGEVYRQGYTVFLCLVQYCIPLVFMTAMYTLTLKSLYSASVKTWVMRRDHVDDEQITVSNETELSSSTSPDNSGMNKKKRAKWKLFQLSHHGTNEANRRATKMFIFIVIVFATCMFPNQVVWLWAEFGNGYSHERHKIVLIICWIITYSNSVCNSVIYAMFSNDFRKGFYGVYGKLCCKSIDIYEVNPHS